MKNKITSAFAAALVGIAGALGVGVAPAHASYADCLSTYVCLWSNSNFGGSLFQWQMGYIMTLPGDCLILTGTQSNTASSIASKAGSPGGYANIFFDLNGGGSNFGRVGPFSDSNLADSVGVPGGFNDKISSICVR